MSIEFKIKKILQFAKKKRKKKKESVKCMSAKEKVVLALYYKIVAPKQVGIFHKFFILSLPSTVFSFIIPSQYLLKL